MPTSPRPFDFDRRSRRLVWGVAASVLAHAALLAALGWHRPAPPAAVPTRGSITWLTARLVPAGAAVRQPQQSHQQPQQQPAPARSVRTPRPVKAAKAPVPRPAAAPVPMAQPVAAPTPEPTREPIRGIAFAVPRIGFGGSAVARGSPLPASAPQAMPMPPMGPPPQVLAQAMREAGRLQIVHALEQQLGVLQAPQDAREGRCSLQGAPDASLACDSDALREAIGTHGEALAQLLTAYRGFHPQAEHIAIAYQQGRYLVAQP